MISGSNIRNLDLSTSSSVELVCEPSANNMDKMYLYMVVQVVYGTVIYIVLHNIHVI